MLKKAIKILLFLFIGFFFWFKTSLAETTHPVISEIKIAGETAKDEFIELYNPTDKEIDLSGWKLKRKTASGNEYPLVSSFPEGTKIPPFSFFLITHPEGYKGEVQPDLTYSSASYSVASNNTIILYNNEEEIIDKVGMGEAADYETNPTLNPEENKSIERKPGELDPEKGNGIDTDNNEADFLLREIPEPQNSSFSEIPEGYNPLENQKPIAIAGPDKEVLIDQLIQFSGAESYDPDGEIVSYSWDLGDGTIKEGMEITYSYHDPGTYLVTLTVVDDKGESAQDSLEVKVNSPPPAAPPPKPPPPPLPEIKINEILPNPIGPDNETEFIELINLSDKSIDLSNWVLDDCESGSSPYQIPEGTSIQPNEYLVFYRADTKIILNNQGGDKVRLLDSKGNLIDEISYKENAPEGKSYSKLEENWIWTNPTPGKVNETKKENQPEESEIEKEETEKEIEPQFKPNLYLSEIFPYPKNLDLNQDGKANYWDEFIEIKNEENFEIDLTGWKLEDESGNKFEIKNEKIKPNEFKIFWRTQTKIPLNNSGGEKIFLYDKDGNQIDLFQFSGNALPDHSLNRILATNEGEWSKTPTPGEENQLELEEIKAKETEKTEIRFPGEVIEVSKNFALVKSLNDKSILKINLSTIDQKLEKGYIIDVIGNPIIKEKGVEIAAKEIKIIFKSSPQKEKRGLKPAKKNKQYILFELGKRQKTQEDLKENYMFIQPISSEKEESKKQLIILSLTALICLIIKFFIFKK